MVQQPNILHGIPSTRLEFGGPPRSVNQLCKALAISGAQVSLLTRAVPPGECVPTDSRVRLIHYPDQGKVTCAALTRLLGEERFDLVHDHGVWLAHNIAVSGYARRHGSPLVIAPRGMLEPWALNHHKWKKKLAWLAYQKKILKNAAAFHATAPEEARQIRRFGFRQPIVILPNGVDFPERSALHHEDHETRTMLFLSRIHAKKGLPMLLEVWNELRPENWKLRIVGNDEGGHAAQIRTLVKRYGLAESVTFEDALEGEAKEEAYLQADAFVLPTYSENFGIVVAEAMSYGLPVITTTAAPWKLLSDRQCGWWVKPEPTGIREALVAATALTRHDRLAMGRIARELTREQFAWPGIGEKMIEFYNWLLGRESRKPDFVWEK